MKGVPMLWAQYLSTGYNASLTLNYNYAKAGAITNSTIFPTTVLAFTQQTESLFLPLAGTHPSSAPWTSSDALAGVFIGINE